MSSPELVGIAVGTLLAHLGEGRLRRPAMPVGRLRASLRSEHPEHQEGDRGDDDRRDDDHDSGIHDPSLPAAGGHEAAVFRARPAACWVDRSAAPRKPVPTPVTGATGTGLGEVRQLNWITPASRRMRRVRTAETSNEPRQPSWLEKKTNTALRYPCRGRTIGASGTCRPGLAAIRMCLEGRPTNEICSTLDCGQSVAARRSRSPQRRAGKRARGPAHGGHCLGEIVRFVDWTRLTHLRRKSRGPGR